MLRRPRRSGGVASPANKICTENAFLFGLRSVVRCAVYTADACSLAAQHIADQFARRATKPCCVRGKQAGMELCMLGCAQHMYVYVVWLIDPLLTTLIISRNGAARLDFC